MRKSGIFSRAACIRSICAVLVACVSIACTRDAKMDAPTDARAENVTTATSDASISIVDAGADAETNEGFGDAPLGEMHVGDIHGDYVNAPPARAKSIGHTSIVFKLTLTNGKRGAFKPESKRGHTRYRGEIAAYRLARWLEIGNVPAAWPREVNAPKLRTALGDGADIVDREVIVHDNAIHGAIIHWIDKLDFLALEKEPLASQWRGWLKEGATLSKDDANLAQQIATMCVFDAVTGNWDRWSGGNVGIDRENKLILFIDNDGAFYDPVPKSFHDKQLEIIRGIDVFPQAFIAKLRGLDADALSTALGTDYGDVPLLSKNAQAGVLSRAKEVIAIIDEKIAKRGATSVLAFP